MAKLFFEYQYSQCEEIHSSFAISSPDGSLFYFTEFEFDIAIEVRIIGYS